MKAKFLIFLILFLMSFDAMTQSNKDSILNTQIQGEWKTKKADSVNLIFGNFGYWYPQQVIQEIKPYKIEGNKVYEQHYNRHLASTRMNIASDSTAVTNSYDYSTYSPVFFIVQKKNGIILKTYEKHGLFRTRFYKKE